jgi:hypothetical protein
VTDAAPYSRIRHGGERAPDLKRSILSAHGTPALPCRRGMSGHGAPAAMRRSAPRLRTCRTARRRGVHPLETAQAPSIPDLQIANSEGLGPLCLFLQVCRLSDAGPMYRTAVIDRHPKPYTATDVQAVYTVEADHPVATARVSHPDNLMNASSVNCDRRFAQDRSLLKRRRSGRRY